MCSTDKAPDAWGVRLTWPDGHSEVDGWDERRGMEVMFRHAGDKLKDGDTEAVPEMVTRTVQVGEWTSVPELMTDRPTAYSGLRFEWGVRRTWPDGHTEVRTRNRLTGARYDRHEAENLARGDTEVSAEAVGRTVQVGEWAPVGKPEAS